MQGKQPIFLLLYNCRMIEEDLPEIYKPPPKKEKPLFTGKAWKKIADDVIAITPQTDPLDAFRQIRQRDSSRNPHISQEERNRERVTNAIREERLRREGLNPDEWAYYVGTQPIGYGSRGKPPIGEVDMERWSSGLPQGLELYIVQGAVSSGSEFHEANYDLMDHNWEVYVRVRPNELGEGQKAIEPPASTS